MSPGLHPDPPADLARRQLPIKNISVETSLFRVYQAKYNSIYFGRSGQSRFDAPSNEYGVLYLATDEFCAFRETIGRLSQYRLITQTLLAQRRLAEIQSQKELILVDLTGAGLTKLDADGRLLTGDYSIAQKWSIAFYNHPEQPDGIYYRSRYDPERFCVALYERGIELEVKNVWNFLDKNYAERLAAILNIYDYGLV